MEIRTFHVDTYKGNRIYFRQWADTFEYLIVARGQIFTDNVRVKRPLIGRIKHALRKSRTPYGEDLLKKAIGHLVRLSHAKVDYIMSKQYEIDLRKKQRAS